jgi:hypothetical protein
MNRRIGLLILMMWAIMGTVIFAVPVNINIQVDVANDDGTPLTGIKPVIVKVHESDESVIWQETIESVTFISGVAGFQIGAVTPLDTLQFVTANAYLSLTVEGNSVSIDLGSVPYSMFSYAADVVDEIYMEDVFYLDQSSGKVGIGVVTSPDVQLHVSGGVRLGETEEVATGVMRFKDNVLQGRTLTEWLNLDFDPSDGYLSKWIQTDDTTYVLGKNIGIGTTTPSERLEVQGTGRFSGAVSANSLVILSGDMDIAGAYEITFSGGVKGESITLTDQADNHWNGSELKISGTYNGNGGGLSDLGASVLSTASVTTLKIDNFTIVEGKIVSGSVGTRALGDGAITNVKLASGLEFVESHLVDQAVTDVKIGVGQIDASKLSSGFVLSLDYLVDSAVDEPRIRDQEIVSSKIVTAAITTEKIAEDSVQVGHIVAGTVQESDLGNASVSEASIIDSSVSNAMLLGPLGVSKGGLGATSYASDAVLFYDGAVITGSVQTLFWDKTLHRLGVGTNSPSDLIHVLDDKSPLLMRVEDFGGVVHAAAIQLKNNQRDWAIQTTAQGRMAINDLTAGFERFTLKATTSVGIGVTNPIEALEVDGAIQIGDADHVVPNEGTVRYKSADGFELWNGAYWVSLGEVSQYEGVTYGSANKASTFNATVLGGTSNNSLASHSTVIGGASNNLLDGHAFSVIGGGTINTMTNGSGVMSDNTIGGGRDNKLVPTTSLIKGVVAGGESNTIRSDSAYIGGGISHDVASVGSGVWGGNANQISAGGSLSVINGGQTNTISAASFSSIVGGVSNAISGNNQIRGGDNEFIALGGGFQNHIAGQGSHIGAGIGNQINGAENSIGGGSHNQVQGSAALISGGRANHSRGLGIVISGGELHQVNGSYSTIQGGYNHQIQGDMTTVGGGMGHRSEGYGHVINGGDEHWVSGIHGTISGGEKNVVAGSYGTIGGGQTNLVSGKYAAVLGGYNNEASGDGSVAMGRHAKATHDGSFVWSDGAESIGLSTERDNQFIVKAGGGVSFYTGVGDGGVVLDSGSGSWAVVSDRNKKTKLKDVDGESILTKLEGMKIQEWEYRSKQKDSKKDRHIGPMAQDFYAAYGLGHDETHISTVDADGIVLLAIQELNRRWVMIHDAIQVLRPQVNGVISDRKLVRGQSPIYIGDLMIVEKMLSDIGRRFESVQEKDQSIESDLNELEMAFESLSKRQVEASK